MFKDKAIIGNISAPFPMATQAASCRPQLRNKNATAGATIALIALCCMPLVSAQSAPELPEGPAQPKVRTACLECHDAGIIVQQRLSKLAWTKEVDKMIKWGALVEATDRDSFVDYLSTNFPADKPRAEMPRAVSVKKH